MPDDGIFYDADANPDALKGKTIAILGYGSQGHAHALNLKESGYDVVVGLRADSSSRAEGRGGRARGARRRRRREPRRRGDDPASRREAGRGLGDRDLRRDRPGQPAHVRARLRDPLRPDRAARRGRRRHGGAEGARAPRPPPVRGGQGRALPDGDRPGRHRQRPRAGARLRVRHRRRARRDHRDDLQGRVRDRPVRRAVGALRRRDRARARRLRDPGRGRLRPAPRLLRDASTS